MTQIWYNSTLMWQFGIILPSQDSAKIACMVFDNLQAAYIVHGQESGTVVFNIHNGHTKYTISYQGNDTAIYNAIAMVVTIFLNKNDHVQSMEGINIDPYISTFINNGLSLRGFLRNNNVYSKKPKPTIKDVRDQFMLWEHHDKCAINLLPNSKIHFYHIEDPKHRFISTSLFCEAIGMSGEQTLVWALKYGNTLPKYLE